MSDTTQKHPSLRRHRHRLARVDRTGRRSGRRPGAHVVRDRAWHLLRRHGGRLLDERGHPHGGRGDPRRAVRLRALLQARDGPSRRRSAHHAAQAHRRLRRCPADPPGRPPRGPGRGKATKFETPSRFATEKAGLVLAPSGAHVVGSPVLDLRRDRPRHHLRGSQPGTRDGHRRDRRGGGGPARHPHRRLHGHRTRARGGPHREAGRQAPLARGRHQEARPAGALVLHRLRPRRPRQAPGAPRAGPPGGPPARGRVRRAHHRPCRSGRRHGHRPGRRPGGRTDPAGHGR